MSRHASLAAFLVTVAVIVPTAWHGVGASIQTDGKRLRPLQQSLTVDGARITVDVDRSVVMTGTTVEATLVAYSATPKQVVVDLTAMHSSNHEGERVEQPWTAIDHETIKLVAAPDGGKPVATTIKLGERPKSAALFDSFKIFVTPHGMKAPKHDYDDDWTAIVNDGKAAAVAIRGWSGNNLGLQLEARGPLTAGAPFTIAVRVKNTTGGPLDHKPWVTLSTEDALSAQDGKHVPALEIAQLDDDSLAAGAWPRGAEHVVLFKVTPHEQGPGKVTFLAEAVQNDGLGPIEAGAVDAKTFTIAAGTPSVAVQ